jgi:hypothetical protein
MIEVGVARLRVAVANDNSPGDLSCQLMVDDVYNVLLC